MKAIAKITPAAIMSALGWLKIWLEISLPRLRIFLLAGDAGGDDTGGQGDEQRGDLGDEAAADREEGIVWAACRAVMPCIGHPMIRPPMMLMTAMTIPAMTSPLTNFIAPSMAP